MDILAQIMSEKHENPIEFLNQLRQTTEPIGGGMEYCDNGEYVDYDVAIEAVKKAQKQLIDKLEDWLANNICNAYNFRGDDISATFMNDCIKAMKGE